MAPDLKLTEMHVNIVPPFCYVMSCHLVSKRQTCGLFTLHTHTHAHQHTLTHTHTHTRTITHCQAS